MTAIKQFVGVMALGLFLIGGAHAADYTFTAPGQSWLGSAIAIPNTPFDTTLTIDLTTQLQMDITFFTTMVQYFPASGVYDTYVEILDSSSASLFSSTISQPSGFANFTGWLSAGSYSLHMWSTGGMPTVGGSYGALSVSSVPLPAALLLFGSALAGFGFVGRRRSKG